MFTVELKTKFEAPVITEPKVNATTTTTASAVVAPAGKKQGFNFRLLSIIGEQMFTSLIRTCRTGEHLFPGRDTEMRHIAATKKYIQSEESFNAVIKGREVNGPKALKTAKKWQDEMVLGKAKALFMYESKPILKAINKFHKEEATQHCWRWEYKDCYSLCMGYRSDFLRKAEAAKGVDKKVYYLLAKAMEDRDYIQTLYNSINSAVDKAIKSEL